MQTRLASSAAWLTLPAPDSSVWHARQPSGLDEMSRGAIVVSVGTSVLSRPRITAKTVQERETTASSDDDDASIRVVVKEQ